MAYSPVIESMVDVTDNLRIIVSEVMDIVDVTTSDNDDYTARFRGRLVCDSEDAYEKMRVGFGALSHTPLFRLEDGQHVIIASRGVSAIRANKPWLSVLLFILTLGTVLLAGVQIDDTFSDVSITAFTIIRLLSTGVPFAASLLGILLAHEMGHYFAARWHGAAVSPPYFIPFPGSYFGTMGAVIKMRAPIRNRRVLLDIAVAGPLAGFVVAVPILIIGLHLSDVTTLPATGFQMEGNSLIYLGAKYLVHGKLLPEPASYGGVPPLIHWVVYFFTGQPAPSGGTDVLVHPVAWAGWAGLLVTGLNLIPVGQLDGGHTLYVLLGRRVRVLFPFIVGAVLLMGFVWQGWWLWAVMIYMFGRQQSPLLDEITPLDETRRLVAIATLLLFILLVTPVPLRIY